MHEKVRKKVTEKRRYYTIFLCNPHCGQNICSKRCTSFSIPLRQKSLPNFDRKPQCQPISRFPMGCALPHSYSPNTDLSDYHFFPRLKKELGGRKFENKEEFIVGVLEILQNLGRDLYRDGIEKLVPHLDKCLDHNGNYIEKQLVPPLFNKLCFEIFHAFADFLEGR